MIYQKSDAHLCLEMCSWIRDMCTAILDPKVCQKVGSWNGIKPVLICSKQWKQPYRLWYLGCSLIARSSLTFPRNGKMNGISVRTTNCMKLTQLWVKVASLVSTITGIRSSIRTQCRLGHSRITHKFLISNEDPMLCTLCQSSVSLKHNLLNSSGLSSIGKLYYSENNF